MWESLFINGAVATMSDDISGPYGLVDDGAIAVEDGKIAWVGEMGDIASEIGDAAREVHDLNGAVVTPGLIDCHTHLVYAGDRAGEFEARLQGTTYEAIAAEGGGILSTVKATREASEDELLDSALLRLDDMIAEGVVAVEIKSGYGLDTANEIKMLRIARALGEERDVQIKTTFLGAHALPPEFDDRDAYVEHICSEMLPEAHRLGLVDAVDGFCESVGFTPAQIERVFSTAHDLELRVKLHAEQFSNSGGARLAARFSALSVDHLEYLSAEDAKVIANASVVAVLLPGAFYFLQETQKPPVSALRAAGVSIAVATDCNPGSSPMTSILLAMNMACIQFGLTPEEALAGATRYAAKALGIDDQGVIAPGFRADFAVWDVANPAALSATIGQNTLISRVYKGEICP
ncbi:MAG: imidazolonepropionase [Pseudomonadota bacterium]